jgi:T4 RnlA family RNA ligase
MPEDLDTKKIVRVQNKEDGSIISFIRFKNGKIRAKSKMSFISEQAQMAQELLDTDEQLHEFITRCLDEDLNPIFEVVSPFNQIVVPYENTELRLLQVRMECGTYVSNLSNAKAFNIIVAEHLDLDVFTLKHMLDLKKTSTEDIEGWVITFEDYQMCKIKTDHYLRLHGLIGPDMFRENLLIEAIINNTIDDVISALPIGVKRDRVITLTDKVQKYYNHLIGSYNELLEEYKQLNSRKDFAIKYSRHPLFSALMKTLHISSTSAVEKAVKETITNKCNTLSKAKEFIDSLE